MNCLWCYSLPHTPQTTSLCTDQSTELIKSIKHLKDILKRISHIRDSFTVPPAGLKYSWYFTRMWVNKNIMLSIIIHCINHVYCTGCICLCLSVSSIQVLVCLIFNNDIIKWWALIFKGKVLCDGGRSESASSGHLRNYRFKDVIIKIIIFM